MTSAPRVACICGSGATLQIGCNKNKFAASDEVMSCIINDQSYSLIGFNHYAIKKMVDSYSYVCVLNHCHTCGRA